MPGRLNPPLVVVSLGAVVYAGWMFARRATDNWRPTQKSATVTNRTAEVDRIYGGAEMKILQFYARDGRLIEGTSTILCYGVVNARAVRIEPSVQRIAPSINRCIEVAPERDTRYTLIAEGHNGQTVSESLLISVEPDTAALPRITSFRIGSRTSDYTGKTVISLSFSAVNAEELSIDPAVFPPLHGLRSGNFYVTPRRTTTYTLTAKNKRGHIARRQLTVEVPGL